VNAMAPLSLPTFLDRPGLRPVLRFLPTGLLLLTLATFPAFVSSPDPVHLGVNLFLAVALGSAWNLLGGFAGEYSLGHAAYFGVGAYTAILLLERLGVPPWWGMGAAMVAAALLAAIVGSIAFRPRGPLFLLVSLAVAEVLRLAAIHFRSFTHGAEGLAVTRIPAVHVLGKVLRFQGERPFYYLTLALAILAVLVSRIVLRSRLGYALRAIREDPAAARSLGIDVTFTRSAALVISAALTGLAGAAFAGYAGSIDPSSAFGLTGVSVEAILVCVVGGLGTVEGPILGALLLIPLEEALRNPHALVALGLLPDGSSLVGFAERYLSHADLLVRGLLLVAFLLFAPAGVAGLLKRVASRRRAGSPAAIAPVP
jgi:branched-chain amino acid transport system permease protein